MAAQHGGLHPNQVAQDFVDKVGGKLVANTNSILEPGAKAIPYRFEFHVLRDEEAVNAFAPPGGQVFITAALLKKFQSEDQLAGVLGHEVGHVLAKHSNQQMAKAGLFTGVRQAVAILVGGEGGMGGHTAGSMVNKVLSSKFGRDDETESDAIGAELMKQAGYDARQLIEVMKILQESSSGRSGPEFLTTHPLPKSRIDHLKNVILPGLGY
ncbi:MAG: M48 family metallopeptidase [Verrucomicrobiales bacterium]